MTIQTVTEKWMKGKRATHLEVEDDGTKHVVYHSTRVVSWREVNEAWAEVTLRTGGWQSATTKTRMNEVADEYGLGFSVYQEKKIWYIWFKNRGVRDERLHFTEGMTFKVEIMRRPGS